MASSDEIRGSDLHRPFSGVSNSRRLNSCREVLLLGEASGHLWFTRPFQLAQLGKDMEFS
jgi:hypothetical protein